MAPNYRARRASAGAIAVAVIGTATVLAGAGGGSRARATSAPKTAALRSDARPIQLPHGAALSGHAVLASYRPHHSLSQAQLAAKGLASESVRRLQYALGIYDDGILGPQTDSAVRAFQRTPPPHGRRDRRPADVVRAGRRRPADADAAGRGRGRRDRR